MKLTIKYFGMIEEATGKAEEQLDFQSSITVDELKTNLQSTYPSIADKNFQIAIDQTLAGSTELISEDCEIALLPPFAGG